MVLTKQIDELLELGGFKVKVGLYPIHQIMRK